MMAKERNNGDGRGIKVVRERYSDLNYLIGDLSTKLSEVSSSIDNEFLSAYRVHMVDVQEDLRSLKQQVATAESALHDDSAVATLETEVNWFSDETSRLKSHAMSMRKDMHHILSRIDALNEQRHFLNDQLKQVLKRSKVLEVEINGATSMSILDQRKPSTDMQRENISFGNTRPDIRPVTPEGYYNTHAKYRGASGTSNKDVAGLWSSSKFNRSQSAEAPSAQTSQRPAIRDVLITSSSTAKVPAGDSSSRKDAGSQLELLLSQRSPEEIVLEKELDSVYKEILQRKKASRSRVLTSSKSARSVIQADVEMDEQQLSQHWRRMGGVTGLGLDLFLDADRIKAVQNFLAQPEVFERVVQVLAVNYANIGLQPEEDPEL